MKAMMQQEELRMAQSKKQRDNIVDMVNSPPHYNQTGIECIHAISAATGDGYKHYLQGNIMKYLWRFDYKAKPVEDLEKARWYLDRLIEEVMADAS
jgi:uncharacterized Ntn-hydrolase superfamily protein